jgi:hypothetical protein
MSEGSGSRYSNIVGSLGILCVGSFWLALLAPERVDKLLRPYGLYAVSGVLVAAVILPSIAAIAGSKRWLFASALAVITLVKFFLGVSS